MDIEHSLDVHLPELSRRVADGLGLHFPPERWPELRRGIARAAEEFGFASLEECSSWLLETALTSSQLRTLACHLTVGETYFFRDRRMFETIATSVLPDMLHARRGRAQRLRLWSAGCCTGEEAYSLAIMLRQSVPDLHDWKVTILGTDINANFIRKAIAATYAEWSFRDTLPDFKLRYFTPVAGGRFAVREEIRSMVTFAHVNLVEDVYPSLINDTNAMDLIFCRNVLMYFTPEKTRSVIAKLHHALCDGGWLAVAPSEASHTLFPQFRMQVWPGVILYKKTAERERRDAPATLPLFEFPAPAATELPRWFANPAPSVEPAPVERAPLAEHTPTTPFAAAQLCYESGNYSEVVATLSAVAATDHADPRLFPLMARAFANQGQLADALAWCERWVARDKMNAAAHYLRAIVLLEQGDGDQCRRALQRALYLDPAFVLAHFALGNLARGLGKTAEADKHYSNAAHLLRGMPGDEALPESDGLTAARLMEIITSISSLEQIPQ